MDERLFSGEIKVLQKLSKRIEKEIKDILGVTCSAKLVEPKTIQRSEGKAKRVIDNPAGYRDQESQAGDRRSGTNTDSLFLLIVLDVKETLT